VHEVFRRVAARGHSVTEIVSSFPEGTERDELDAIRFERIASLPAYYPRAAARCARAEPDVVVERLTSSSPAYSADLSPDCAPPFGPRFHLARSRAAPCGVEWASSAYRRAPIVAISESTRDDLPRGFPRRRWKSDQHPLADASRADSRRAPLIVCVGGSRLGLHRSSC
jgi:hypothetical protein